MGVSVAYWLARAGVSAVVLEARALASGATGRNAGLMLAGSKPLENPELVQAVLQEEGIDAGYATPGHMALAASEGVWDQFCEEANRRRGTPAPVFALDHSACEDLLGMKINKRFLGGRWLPHGGIVNPTRLVYGLATAALHHGASVISHTSVLQVDAVPGHEYLGISTTRGILRAQQVVFACNTALSIFAPEFKDVVTPVRGQVLSTQPLPPIFKIGLGVDFGTVYWRQSSDGVIVIGGYRNRDPITETTTKEDLNSDIQQALTDFLPDAFPGFPPISISRRWAGIMDYPSDGNPLIGAMPGSPGRWVISGFGGHGLPGALGAGNALAEAIATGQAPPILEPFNPGRFMTP